MTLVMWVTSVITFVIVYSMAQRGTSLLLIAGVTAALVVLWLGLVLALNTRQLRRFLADNNAAVAALSRGELERAHDVFRRWSEKARAPAAAALARHNLGNALIRLGRLQQAAAVIADNDERHARALKSLSMYKASAADAALAHALAGELDQAEQWMAKADARDGESHLPGYPGNKAFSRAVIDCRAGRPADAARLLDESWAEYEAALTGDATRSLRVVRAFAHASSDVRNAGVAENVLAGMRPVYRGEFDYLGVAWPEMATFLAAHGLASAEQNANAEQRTEPGASA